MASDLDKVRNRAAACCAWDDAANPEHSRSVSEYLGLHYIPFNRESVQQRFGERAAKAWQDAVDARSEFYDAVQQRER